MITYIPIMTLGWLWFVLSLGIALMIAAAQQLAPTAFVFWVVLFAVGAGFGAAAIAGYLVREARQTKKRRENKAL